MKILNLTQHAATPDQVAAGVIEPRDKSAVQALLTFTALPDGTEIRRRASALARLAKDECLRADQSDALYDAVPRERCEAAMIGGAPYLMATLEVMLRCYKVPPLYSFSERRSEEVTQPDGSVRKVTTFAHIGWVTGVAELRTF